mmetsp:Transcript_80884/g.215861  ORF Transcript_80884/g.215861 Transcript_80884/m.215861 type:complete len:220 (-) Transcript_80884:2534-3193(-)
MIRRTRSAKLQHSLLPPCDRPHGKLVHCQLGSNHQVLLGDAHVRAPFHMDSPRGLAVQVLPELHLCAVDLGGALVPKLASAGFVHLQDCVVLVGLHHLAAEGLGNLRCRHPGLGSEIEFHRCGGGLVATDELAGRVPQAGVVRCEDLLNGSLVPHSSKDSALADALHANHLHAEALQHRPQLRGPLGYRRDLLRPGHLDLARMHPGIHPGHLGLGTAQN